MASPAVFKYTHRLNDKLIQSEILSIKQYFVN